MILWIIKQILSLRQVFTGRARPSELAWGLALGVAIGLVPKGNLVSVLLIGVLVSVRVNHGMAALAAVGFSFLAMRLDIWTHELGAAVLGSARVRPWMERVWSWPLMPWTDLNNTVVMGSTVAAAIALLPTYLLSMPLFRWIAPHQRTGDGVTDPPPATAESLAAGAESHWEEPAIVPASHVFEEIAATAAAPPLSLLEPSPSEPLVVHVETQIDVIRIKPSSDADDDLAADSADPIAGGQMNEALGYLLRRLRDSRQGKAA